MATKKKRKARKRPTGAPCKLTDALQIELNRHVEEGCTYADAAALCRISPASLHKWVAAAKEGKSYGRLSKAYMRNFLENLEQSKTLAKTGLIKSWRSSGLEDWKAAEALLAIRYPDEYAKRSLLDVTSAGEKVAPVVVFSPADLSYLEDGDG